MGFSKATILLIALLLANLVFSSSAPKSCSILPNPITISAGEQIQLSVFCFSQSGGQVPCPSLSWSSTIGSISPAASPFPTFSAGIKAGSGTVSVVGTYEEIIPIPEAIPDAGAITANSIAGIIKRGQFTCSAQATVLPNKPANLKVLPPTATVEVGKSQRFSAELYDSYGNKIQQSYPITWSSSGGIGSIDHNGVFLATNPGFGKVIATYLSEYSQYSYYSQKHSISLDPPVSLPRQISGSAEVTVIVPEKISCQILPADASIQAGGKQRFTVKCFSSSQKTADAHPQEVPCPNMFWQASSGSFQAEKHGSAVFFAGEKVGNVRITVSNADSKEDPGAITCSTSAKIIPDKIAHLFISPEKTTIRIGDVQQFVATGLDRYGNTIANPEVFWSSDQIGTIDNKGLFKPNSIGSGRVTAKLVSLAEEATEVFAQASVSVLPRENPSGSGSGGSSPSGASNTGGAMFSSVSTLSYVCAGKQATLDVKLLKPKSTVIAEIYFLGESKPKKVFSGNATSDMKMLFLPESPGDYELRVSVGTEQRTISFRVPACTPSNANISNNITISLSPPPAPPSLPFEKENETESKGSSAPASQKQGGEVFGISISEPILIGVVAVFLALLVAHFFLPSFWKKPA
ncbi:MAG: hypothetical protein QW275_00125 [Candidatus Anstonellaceae archaeon]